MKKRNGLSKAISIFLVTMLTLSLTACGENNSRKESKITTAERLSTEEPVTVTTGFVEPDIDIDPGAIITTQTETETETETQTETQTETETTTEASTSAPQGQYAYTYTIYGDIVLSMDINVDDYIGVAKDGHEYFSLWKLAADMGWMSLGIYDRDTVYASDDGNVFGPEFWTYPCGDYRTYFCPYYASEVIIPDSPSSKYHPFMGGIIDFVKTDSLGHYYDDEDDNHNLINIDVKVNVHTAQYTVDGYTFMVSRDDLILIAYILWFMPQHGGEAEPFCSQFGNSWYHGGSKNNINLE